MGCAHAGGHNIIGGLLDYLLERHPGSQLIGFKDGPGGILTKSFMDITEDIMVRIFSPSNSLLAKDSRSKYIFECLHVCFFKLEITEREMFGSHDRTMHNIGVNHRRDSAMRAASISLAVAVTRLKRKRTWSRLHQL